MESSLSEPFDTPDSNAPLIIPRKDHTISRSMIDREALKVLYRLSNHGFKAYLVGGGVRDLLLGRTPKDFDVATDARPEQVRRLFRNSRIIGRRFRLVHVFFHNGKIVEVSTFRRTVQGVEPAENGNSDNADGLHEETELTDEDLPVSDVGTDPENGHDDGFADFEETGEGIEVAVIGGNGNGADAEVRVPVPRMPDNENHYGTPEEDARRRDITINALFYNIADFTIIDYVGGMRDLREGIVRSVGCPHRSISEDPVRMIRVIRHAARTGFRIDPATYEAVCLNAPLIVHCSPARVREEFLRDLRGGASHHSFHVMVETGLLTHLFPAYSGVLSAHNGEETKGCLLRNLKGIDCLNKQGRCLTDPMLLAAFVAPFVRHERVFERAPDGRMCISFFHQEVREIIKPIVRNFGFSKANAEQICQTVIGMLLIEQAAKDTRPLPRSLTNKAYFGDGYTLYAVEAEGAGDSVPIPLRQAYRRWETRFAANGRRGPGPCDKEQPARSGPRRRRRRRGGPRPPEAEGGF